MRNRTQAARGRVWALLVVASIAMFQLQFVMTPTASADNACSGAFSGTPDGSLKLVAVPNPGTIAAGTTINLTATWDPADWTSLDRYANCLQATVNGSTSISTLLALRPPELSNSTPTVKDTFQVPSTWSAGDSFCIRARLSGNPTGQNTSTQKTDILCWKIGDTPKDPDVKITKSASPTAVVSGDLVKFTLKVDNVGAGDAQGVKVVDTIPSGFQITDKSPECTQAGQTVTCDLGMIAAGLSKSVTITVKALDGACPSVENEATVSATNEPAANVGADNKSRVTVNVSCPKPDVEIKKTASKSPVAGGEKFFFTLTAKNVSTVTATDVVIRDSVPSRFTIDSVVGAGCSFTGQDVKCDPVVLKAGESKEVTIHVTATVGACATIDNTATVTATDDTNPNNNSAKATVIITCDTPDVKIEKSASTTSVSPGGAVTFTLKVTNLGNAKATSVVVKDTIPTGMTITSAPGCTISGQNVTCNVGDIAAGGTANVSITVAATAGACPSVNNKATVTASNEPSGATANNDSNVVTVNVSCPDPDVQITKSSGAPTTGVKPGESFTYTLKVTNTGGADATGVKVTDAIPAGLTIMDPGTCSVSGNALTCDLGTIAAGASKSVTITVKATENACPMVTNRASVTATNEPTVNQGNNNSNDVTTLVNCEPPPPPEEGIAVRIVKTNDADRDGDYTDNEEARRPDADVPFLLVITNTGEDPWAITDLTDRFDGQTVNLLRDKCSELKGVTLQPGESASCNFTLNGYAPPADDPKDNVAEVCVESMTGTKTDCDDDDSRVRSRDVLGRTITPTKTPPGGTAYTGSEGSLGFGAIALSLLLLGSGLVWAGYRKRQQYEG